MPSINISAQLKQPTNVPRGGRPLGETYNFEEDKVSPEKEYEKPIYESSEGPIQKTRSTLPGRSNVQSVTHNIGGGNARGKNVVANSFESFGPNAVKRSLVLGGTTNTAGGPNGGGYMRSTIKDDFLELDEDDESSIRASAESGEIQATFPRKR